MKKQILIAAAMLGVVSGSAGAVELTGNAGIVSEYLFRGVPQTDGKAAAQGGLDLGWDSGFYAGTWASSVRSGDSVDMGMLTPGTNGIEVDLYGGWGGESGDFSYAIGGTYYTYTDKFDDDYIEANLNLGWSFLSIEATKGEYKNFTGPTLDYTFLAATAEFNGVYATVGDFGDDFKGQYFEAGYGNTLTVGDQDLFDYSISYIYSDKDLLGANENTLIFGIVKNFDIWAD